MGSSDDEPSATMVPGPFDPGWVKFTPRDYIELRVNEAVTRIMDHFKADARALEVALEASNKRLDGMNEFRKALEDYVNRSLTRIEVEAKIAEVQASVSADIRPMQVKLDVIQAPNWTLVGVLGGFGVSMVAAVWLIIGLKIDAVNAPINIRLEASRVAIEQINGRLQGSELAAAASTQADALSRGDRLQLNTRVLAVESLAAINTSEQRSSAVQTAAKLTEVETQFKSESDALNTGFDSDQQMLAILYETVFPGKHLPPRSFRPNLFR